LVLQGDGFSQENSAKVIARHAEHKNKVLMGRRRNERTILGIIDVGTMHYARQRLLPLRCRFPDLSHVKWTKKFGHACLREQSVNYFKRFFNDYR
jgi:hypothetical protein